MNARIEGTKLILELDLETPTSLQSGKTLLVASTHGYAKTGVTVNGKEVSVSVNAFIKK